MEQVTPAELAIAVRVLSALSCSAPSVEAVATAKEYRALRKAMAPIVQDAVKRRHGGLAPMEYARKRQLRKEAEARQKRQVAQDEHYVATRQLRAGRLARLGALASAESELAAIADGGGPAKRPRVLDGAVDTVALGLAETHGEAASADADAAAAAAGAAAHLHRARQCYTCKRRFDQLHHFYDLLCPQCSRLNWRKRLQSADLAGRYAVVTGGRVKIGFETALKLLRSGCEVVVTTRFPKDAALRFAAKDDSEAWLTRLQVCGVDFRDMAQINRFCAVLSARLPRLDVLIHNACQTIRRPTSYYSHLVPIENAPPATAEGECSFIYRYMLRESCSQFDSLPLTSLTIPIFAETIGTKIDERYRAHISFDDVEDAFLDTSTSAIKVLVASVVQQLDVFLAVMQVRQVLLCVLSAFICCGLLLLYSAASRALVSRSSASASTSLSLASSSACRHRCWCLRQSLCCLFSPPPPPPCSACAGKNGIR